MDQETALKDWEGTKHLPPDTTRFTANGHEYRVMKSLSIDRYEAYEVLQVEIGFSRSFQQFHEQAKEALALCNKVASGKEVFADLAILLRDMVIGCALLDGKQTPSILKMCSLFIVRENEDLKTIDDQVIQDKVDDWRQEGIDVRFFFQFALHSIPGFIEAFRLYSPGTSSQGNGSPERVEGDSTTSNG